MIELVEVGFRDDHSVCPKLQVEDSFTVNNTFNTTEVDDAACAYQWLVNYASRDWGLAKSFAKL